MRCRGNRPAPKRRQFSFCCGRWQAAGRTGRESLLQAADRGACARVMSEPEMVTTESKIIKEELTEVTMKLNGVRSDVATVSFIRSATLYDLTTKHNMHNAAKAGSDRSA
ncbi:hypothetical protein QTP88_008696 [Uroleucon formosanum]